MKSYKLTQLPDSKLQAEIEARLLMNGAVESGKVKDLTLNALLTLQQTRAELRQVLAEIAHLQKELRQYRELGALQTTWAFSTGVGGRK